MRISRMLIATTLLSSAVVGATVAPAIAADTPRNIEQQQFANQGDTRLDVGEVLDVGQHIYSPDQQSKFGLAANWVNPEWKMTAFTFTNTVAQRTWSIQTKTATPGSARAVMTLDDKGNLVQRNTNEGGHTYVHWRTNNNGAFERKGAGVPHLEITNGGKVQIIVERPDATTYVLWEDGRTVE